LEKLFNERQFELVIAKAKALIDERAYCYGPDSLLVVEVRIWMAYALFELAEFAKVMTCVSDAINSLNRKPPVKGGYLVRCHMLMGDCLSQLDDFSGAETSYRRAVDVVVARRCTRPGRCEVLTRLAYLYSTNGLFDQAEELFREAIEWSKRCEPQPNGSLAIAYRSYAELCLDRRDPEEAERWAGLALEVHKAANDGSSRQYARCCVVCGRVSAAREQNEEAVQYFTSAMRVFERLKCEYDTGYDVARRGMMTIVDKSGL
jgi:tetratricopeptide (TPR) repeat protein